jgi:hypothetical protein
LTIHNNPQLSQDYCESVLQDSSNSGQISIDFPCKNNFICRMNLFV